MTYYMNSKDLDELKKIEEIVNRAQTPNQKLKEDILRKVHNNYNYHNPESETLFINIETLLHKLDSNFRLKITFNGIQSFSESEKNEYHETFDELNALLEKLAMHKI